VDKIPAFLKSLSDNTKLWQQLKGSKDKPLAQALEAADEAGLNSHALAVSLAQDGKFNTASMKVIGQTLPQVSMPSIASSRCTHGSCHVSIQCTWCIAGCL
jgi:hypothetical protein